MSCRTCDHTMHCVMPKLFWCPRCGTLKREHDTLDPEWIEPKIVQRAATLCDKSLDLTAHYTMTRDDVEETESVEQAELALRECCSPPDERLRVDESIRDSDRPY